MASRPLSRPGINNTRINPLQMAAQRLQHQQTRPPVQGGIGIGHAPNPIFYNPGAGSPISQPPVGSSGSQPIQQTPVIDPSGLANTSDGTQIYTDPISGLQYQNVNGQWAEISGHLSDPGAGQGTYNGLPQGTSQLLPGQQGYSAPGTPENQVPGYYQADAQGGYISGDWNAYSNYAQSRGITPFAGPGSTYGGNPVGGADYNTLKQAILGTQAGQPLNPANPANAPSAPITSPVIQPTNATPVTPTNIPPAGDVSPTGTSQTPTTNTQLMMNQNLPGYALNTTENPSGQNGLGPAQQLALQRQTGVSKPINPTAPGMTQQRTIPFGGLRSFAGAAGRLMGRI